MSSSHSETFKPAAQDVNGIARAQINHNDGMVLVQPPRREDLQPSYAQHLEGDDTAAHGWYGGMSMIVFTSKMGSPANQQ